MGVFDKIKNLFTEEEEIEVPIKKEVKHVEIAPPKREVREVPRVEEEPIKREIKEEKLEETKEFKAEPQALNREEKFKFPVYFNDEDFADLPKREEPKKVEVKKPVQPKVEPYKPIVEEKKSFKPSPIISPVYGVLDKNYKKEDIKPSKDRPIKRHVEEKLTVDDIRNKAYGTLEDELEKALIMDEPRHVEKMESTIDIFEELENSKRSRRYEEEQVDLTEELERQKQKIEEINEFIKQNTVVRETREEPSYEEEAMENTYEIEENNFEVKNEQLEEEPIVEQKEEIEETSYEEETKEIEELEKTKEIEELEETKELMLEDESLEETNPLEQITLGEAESIDNGDLFNLIDSMYEKRDDE